MAWLRQCDYFADPYYRDFEALTFWDSLEHIVDVRTILGCAGSFVFVSLPIFDGPGHVMRSKHYRKDEHCWYFTRQGFIDFMGREGFELLENNCMEQELGREDIESFAFRRRAL